MSEKRKAVAALLGAALLWSMGGVLIKWIDWNPMAISGMRSLFAAATLWAIARRPRFDWSLAQVGGAVCYAVTVSLYITAVKLTTAANAILLQYTAPIWIAFLGAWFLKEKPSRLDLASIILSLVGMLLFFWEGLGGVSFLGDLLAAASGLTIAGMMLFLRKQKSGRPLESVLLGNVLAALIGIPYFFAGPGPGVSGWGFLVILGVLQLGTSYALYTYAIKRVTAIEAILILMLEPILNPIWVLLLIGERPRGWALVGGILVLGSAIVRGLFLTMAPGEADPATRVDETEAEPSFAS